MPTYQIGQLRYSGSGCVSSVTSSVSYQNVSINSGTVNEEGSYFQDVVISPNTAFVKDRDYYLSIKIPQDMNYTLTFNIKLIKSEDNKIKLKLENIRENKKHKTKNSYLQLKHNI